MCVGVCVCDGVAINGYCTFHGSIVSQVIVKLLLKSATWSNFDLVCHKCLGCICTESVMGMTPPPVLLTGQTLTSQA